MQFWICLSEKMGAGVNVSISPLQMLRWLNLSGKCAWFKHLRASNELDIMDTKGKFKETWQNEFENLVQSQNIPNIVYFYVFSLILTLIVFSGNFNLAALTPCLYLGTGCVHIWYIMINTIVLAYFMVFIHPLLGDYK